ncbi:hypothetical protein K9L67_03945 [Candidatus Woesearchaeota archaeon]|nr:hypothetical protein [Candidatus Woesearchaeota archaeon]MCF7901354.1 hypothetical protein [Candidatus Woesearchaeota archaeon]MCF8013354.1 hypothetical protein [Candidatus Woesearchaeota archaeon]
MAPKKFLRKDTHKKARIGKKWKNPKGHQNKKRLHVKGHSATVKAGYGRKLEEKNTNKEGLQIVIITSIEELKRIDPKTQTASIEGLGRKKKIELLDEAKKLNITIQNLNIKRYEETANAKQKERQKAAKIRKEKILEKENAAKKAEEKAEKKATKKTDEKPEELVIEEKKKQEKEEKDKILTKAK